MTNVIANLIEANEKKDEKFIANLENILSSNLKDYCTNPLFYSFPIKQIETIIEKSKINDIYTICNILSKASEYKIEEAPLLLQCFNSQTITMDANTKIITSLSKIPICMELKELKENDAQIDYFFEIKEKDKEIEELKKEIKRYTKPDDFVYDIFEATKNGKLSSVKYLIFYLKVDPNIKDKNGYTPLHYASSKGHLDIVKCLVEKGKVNPNINDKYGRTPLDKASKKGHLDIVKYLVEEGKADPNIKDNWNGRTPLHLASENNKYDVVNYLKNLK
jgi:hypothetical protein